jgi:exodeoxyribonuclease V gamma subunit
MEYLAEQLVDCLKDTKGGTSIFEAQSILVQSPGMAQWLKIQIAEHLGIAANIDFPLPSSFIWQLYRQHLSDLPEQSAFTKANMAWKLMAILPGLLPQTQFSSIQNYLAQPNALKTYQLCQKIADVYDQYLVYRPEWILAWESGIDSTDELDVSDHPWQPILWRALCEYSQGLGEPSYHRANLHQSLLNGLNQQKNNEENKSTPLFVFGISAMPVQQLEVLVALAQQREVIIFWFNPCQHYWGDVVDSRTQAKVELRELDNESSNLSSDYLDVGNPLLASWGKLGRDYQDMLLNQEIQQQDGFVEDEPSSLLEHIQSEVLNLQHRGAHESLSARELLSNGLEHPKITITSEDQSLQVHACHSKVRELEILHDQLLILFDKHPSWQTGDVIVMMPDVASYAPFIEGVFASVESKLHIPYAISDRNVAEASPILSSFIQLMALHQSRLGFSDIMAICEVPAVQAKFDISGREFEILQHWLADSGVRWGWDEQDKTRLNLPAERQNTWLFGLERMLAGYAMHGGQLYQNENAFIAPYGDIEGQQAIALGKFYMLSKVLLKVVAFCYLTDSIEAKVRSALSIVDLLYLPNDQELSVLNELRQGIESLRAHQHQYPQDIEHDIFLQELKQNLNESGVGQRFLAGYVNFCTLMPMRSIPFKAVCILGINDLDYPRQMLPIGFDLMSSSMVRKGDRSRRLDDRYLFLEAILSARECLYFSYQGFSAKDNSPQSPSILLSELLEYCQQCFCLEGQHVLDYQQTEQNLLKHIECNHPLQPFSKEYFQQDSHLSSYQSRWLRLIKQQELEQHSPKAFMPEALGQRAEEESEPFELALSELVAFFNNPAKAFFNNRWQARFPMFGDAVVDEEPFTFNALDKYQLNDRLISDEGKQDWQAQLKAEGKLPIGNTGEFSFKALQQQSAKIVQDIESLNGGRRAKRLNITVTVGQWALSGSIDGIYGKKLLMWRAGRIRAKDRINLYLSYLCLAASQDGGKTDVDGASFIGSDGVFNIVTLDQDNALKYLEDFVNLYQKGQSQCLHFYPESAWKWVKTSHTQQTLNEFIGNDFKRGEGQEPHIHRVCPDLIEHFVEFSTLAERLLMPLCEMAEGK